MVAPKQRDGRRWRGLAVVAACVLAAHFVLLGALPQRTTVHVTQFSRFRWILPADTTPMEQSGSPANLAPLGPTTLKRPPTADSITAANETAASRLAAAGPLAATAEYANIGNTAEAPVASSTPLSAQESTALGIDVAASAELNYRVKGQSRGQLWDSVATLHWDQDGTQYNARYQLMSSPTGTRIMTSSGRITPSGLAPTRFSDKGRSELAAHFQRDRNQIIFSANTPPVAIKAGSQDRLSILFQISAILSGNPDLLKEGNTITVHSVGTRDAADWTFTVSKTENASDLAAGPAVWRLMRNAVGEFDQSVEIWVAPTSPHMPERWRIEHSNGDWVDHQLISDVSV